MWYWMSSKEYIGPIEIYFIEIKLYTSAFPEIKETH